MELNKKLVNFESMNENTKLTLAEALLYTKGLAGGYGGDFPLSTASKDSIYRVPATNKFYVCTENYNGSQISAPNSNFVELSVWKNHDRLNNLGKVKLIASKTFSSENPEDWIYQFDGKEFYGFNYIKITISYTLGGVSISWFSHADLPNICQIPYYIHSGSDGINKPLNSNNMYFATFNRWSTNENTGEENFPTFRMSNLTHKIPFVVKIYAVKLYA
nr:MAG TPA: hypothetical protein [Caudoviricetes sp.]